MSNIKFKSTSEYHKLPDRLMRIAKACRAICQKVRGISSLKGWCGITSRFFQFIASKNGYKIDYKEGLFIYHGHAWTTNRGRIIDLTADQFYHTKRHIFLPKRRSSWGKEYTVFDDDSQSPQQDWHESLIYENYEKELIEEFKNQYASIKMP